MKYSRKRITPYSIALAGIAIAALTGTIAIFAFRGRIAEFSRLPIRLVQHIRDSGAGPATASLTIEQAVLHSLEELETYDEHITRRHFVEDTTIEITADIPSGKPIEWILWHIMKDIRGTGYSMSDCLHHLRSNRISLEISRNRPGAPRILLILNRSSRFFSASALMGILVAPFSYRADTVVNGFLAIDEPLTLGLRPTRTKSAWTAQIAEEYNKEVCIIMPMERLLGHRNISSYPYLILVHYPEEKIRHLIRDAVKNTPHAKGVTNIWGGRVLEDTRATSIVLDETARQKCYFLENPVSNKSVTGSIELSRPLSLGSIEEHIDSSAGEKAVMDQFRHAALRARSRGSIILSAPPTTAFLNGLRNIGPVLKHNGIALRYISDIVHSRPSANK